MDKITEGYLEAARKVEQGEEIFSCNAVQAAFASSWCSLKMKDKYLKVFCPKKERHYNRSDALLQQIRMYGRSGGGWMGNHNAETNLRVLMLALMAVCWKDFQ